MKPHRIFNREDIVHALLVSNSHANIFIPVKCTVKDIKWDPVNPKYLVRIEKFYDNIHFLKKYLFNMNFEHSFRDRTRKFKLEDKGFKRISDIEKRLHETDQKRFYVTVHSIHTVKTKLEMKKIFGKLQFFLITRKFSEIKEISTRSMYKGVFRLDSQQEFDLLFKKYANRLFERNGEDINKYLDSL